MIRYLQSLFPWTDQRSKLGIAGKPATKREHRLREPIDVVYTWVDGAQPEFQRELSHHARREFSSDPFIAGERRFRNNDELRYSLRSLETNAAWVNKVFLVTNGQVPRWLKQDHPRVRLVHHREIFPDPSHLPTFNSAAIEAHLHRIPELSSRFLFLNDDMFFGNVMPAEDFLLPSGRITLWIDPWELPRSRTEGDLVSRWLAFNRKLLQQAFGDQSYSCVAHAPILFDRDVLGRMEARWQKEFDATSAERFRTDEMILVQVLYTHFMAAVGQGELIRLSGGQQHPFVMFQPPLENVQGALDRLICDRPPFFCINDDWDEDGETKNQMLTRFLKVYFPFPSSFELTDQ